MTGLVSSAALLLSNIYACCVGRYSLCSDTMQNILQGPNLISSKQYVYVSCHSCASILFCTVSSKYELRASIETIAGNFVHAKQHHIAVLAGLRVRLCLARPSACRVRCTQ